MPARTAEEVFAHHGQALGAGRLDDIIDDYRDDSILIVNDEVFRGTGGARRVFAKLLADVPAADWDLHTVFADDVLYLEWKAQSSERHIDDGVDTFIFDDGRIRVQTVKYSVHPN
jgi:SnoaL-like domain